MTVNMTAVSQPIIDAGLAETKDWLRIETASDDAAIGALLRSAIGMAEDFCAQQMFARSGTERLALSCEWTRLRACPVSAISGQPKQPYVIDQSTCVRCGVCMDACRPNAIALA